MLEVAGDNKSLEKNHIKKIYIKKEFDKDIIIKSQQNELIFLSKELINLANEINDLKVIIRQKKDTEDKIEKAENYIKELKKKNKDILIKNDEKQKELRQIISNMISEKEKQKIKLEQDNIVYNQKMSVINYIEMENKIYKEEVNDLKEKQKLIEKKAKENIQKFEVENILKYKELKQKLLESLNETKEIISKLKLEYSDISGKVTSLQNYQLLGELEVHSQENKELIKENKILKKKIYELENEIEIHRRVEAELVKKVNKLKNKSIGMKSKEKEKEKDDIKKKNISLTYSPSEENNSHIVILHRNNNLMNYKIKDNLKTFLLQNNSGKITNFDSSNKTDRNKNSNNNNNFNTKDSEVNLNNSYFKKGSYSTNYFYPSLKKNKSALFPENEKLKFINGNLKQKLYNYESKYKGLFSFLEESLEKFFKDVENKIQEKGVEKIVYIDIEKIKKFDFSIFNDSEKYSLLILLMNYLLPLITINFSSNCNLKKNIFCTNLNIIDRKFNKNKSYLKDKFLRRAFLGQNCKLKADLYFDNNNFSNSIPILRKSNSMFAQDFNK